MATPAPASDTIDQRFAELIEQFGLTKNAFAVSLGKTASVVQHLVDGRNKPGYDLLCRIFEIYPNVSRDWLLLGRGPMLVSGEPAPKPTEAPAAAPATAPAESELEPIDLSDVEGRPARRTGSGSRLQPEEIMATLALAAAATQPARSNGPASTAPAAAEAPVSPAAAEQETPAANPDPVPSASAPVATPPAPASSVAPAAPPAAAGADAYVAAALHAQHLQHQLALSEMRNQHLLEQQQMLREMLAMTRV